MASSTRRSFFVLSTGCPYKTWMLFLLVPRQCSAPAGNTQGPRTKVCVIKKESNQQ